MGFCLACLPLDGLAVCLRQSPAVRNPSKTITFNASRITYSRVLRQPVPRIASSRTCQRRPPASQQTFRLAAWAGEVEPAISSSFDLENRFEGNSKFKELCYSQLKLVSTLFRQTQGAGGSKLTLYKREPATFDAGQLQLSKLTSYTDLDTQNLPDDLDSTLFLGLAGSGDASRGAEKALAEAQLVDLPNTGAFVLPLAAHSFLVGLLVIEQIVQSPDQTSGTMASVVQPAQMSATISGKGSSTLLSGKEREVVRLAGQVLAAACAMDLHSALDRAQASTRSQQVIGLVEQVRGPLTALRTLGSILAPRLRQKEGQEIDRDVAQGMLTQGDRLQEVVSQLQIAIHPVAQSSSLDAFHQPNPSAGMLPSSRKLPKHSRSKRKPKQPLLPQVKQDSSADDQLHRLH